MDFMEHEPSPPIYNRPKQRFEISRKLGSGTYGKVSLAMDHKMQEQVAVKIIKKSAIENAQDLLRIRREIRIMSALKHPNIVEIKEVFENHEKIIIVMEYADGGELYDYVSQHGPLPEEEVCKIFRQIVSAIYYCHKHGVCHRDLKLENILLDKNGVAKIADFGLSNYFMDHGLLNTFCGSPLYASPEIINGVPYRGPEVDCWSLGVLLYTLAYSSMPFDGRDFNRMVRQIKKGTYYEPDPPSSASMLIRAMLRVNPERRADIDMIASHWWVNFDENLLPIQDLPENQIIDPTPLNLRNETIVIQNFTEDSDMFSEYNCLNARTRRKIDEFRRRRHETSDTFSNNGSYEFGGASSSSAAAPAKRPTTAIDHNQKSTPTVQRTPSHDYANDPLSKLLEPEDSINDPLQRLKDLESRLVASSNHQRTHAEVLINKRRQSKDALAAAAGGTRLDQILHSSETENVPQKVKKIVSSAAADLSSSATSSLENDGGGHNQVKNAQSDIINDTHNEAIPVDVAEQSCTSANQEEGNRLVNQLLEEAERGVVCLALIEKMKSHDAYRTQKFVKEIVDSIVQVQQQQKAASARKQSVTKMSAMARQHSRDASLSRSTNKQSSQDSGDLITQNDLPDLVKNQNDQIVQERPPDLVADDKTCSISGKIPTKAASLKQDSIRENLEEIEEEDVNSTDFEDLEIDDDEDEYMPPSFEPQSTGQDVSPSDSFVTANDSAPKDSTTVSPAAQKEDSYPPGLSKRLSRGKYEKSKFIYGREVYVEPSLLPARQIRLGGAVQPVPEEAPELFDQAKQYILAYPDVAGDAPSSRKMAWLKTVDPDMGSSQEIEETPPWTPRRSAAGVVEQSGNGYKVLWPPPPAQSAAKNVDSAEGCDDHDTSIDAIVCIKMNGPRHKLSRTYDVGTTTIGLPASGDVDKSENEIQEPQQVDDAGKINIDGVLLRRARRPPRRQLGNQKSLETPLELRQFDERDKSSLVDVLLSPKNSIDHTADSTVVDRMKHFSDTKHHTPKPSHDLTADQAVEAAKAYLLHNPDIESERRKHKSWYNEPQHHNDFAADHHQSTLDGYRPSMGASHAFHPEVYQPKSLGAYISPAMTTLHHSPIDPVDSKSSKFRVFQPKGLLKRRSKSMEKSLEQYADEEEDNSNTQQTDLLYSHRWKPTTTSHYLENSTDSPLKSILKKASRFEDDHYDPWPDNKYSTYNYHPMKTDNDQPGALTRLPSNDKLSYLGAEPLVSRYSSRDVPPVTIRPYTYDRLDTVADKTPAVSKKRSLLQPNRRKTTEIRLGALTDALNSTTAAIGDSPYRNKRAASPFEKIKGIFARDDRDGGSGISRTSGDYGGHHPHHTTFVGEFSSGVRPSSVYDAGAGYNRRGSSGYALGRTKL